MRGQDDDDGQDEVVLASASVTLVGRGSRARRLRLAKAVQITLSPLVSMEHVGAVQAVSVAGVAALVYAGTGVLSAYDGANCCALSHAVAPPSSPSVSVRKFA